VQVYCEHGRIVLEEIQSTLYVRKHDGMEMRYGPLPAEQRYPMFAPANNLVEVILGRGKNESPPEVGVRTVELLDAAYRSAGAGGAPVRVADLL
jgi:predicted dehydrogenase